MLTVVAAMINPSFISIGFMILTVNLNIATTFKIEKRLKVTGALMILNMATLIGIVIWKISKIQTMVNHPTTLKKFNSEKRFYESTGFILTNIVRDVDNKKFSYGFKGFESFLFEFMLFIVYCLTINSTWNKYKKIQYLKKNPMEVVLVKNYELKKFYDSDSEDEDTPIKKTSIGVEKRKAKVEEELKRKEAKKENMKKVEKLVNSL